MAQPSWYKRSPFPIGCFAFLNKISTCWMMLPMEGTAHLFCAMSLRTGDNTSWFAFRFKVFFSTCWSTKPPIFGSQWRHNCWCSLKRVRISSVLSHLVAKPSKEKWTDGSIPSQPSDSWRPDSPEDEAREEAGMAPTDPGIPNLVGTPS